MNNTANYTAGAIYGLNSQIHMNGSGTFEGNRVGLGYNNNKHCDGKAIHVEHSSISLYGYFKFNDNQNDGCLNGGGSGIISIIYSSLILQGLI